MWMNCFGALYTCLCPRSPLVASSCWTISSSPFETLRICAVILWFRSVHTNESGNPRPPPSPSSKVLISYAVQQPIIISPALQVMVSPTLPTLYTPSSSSCYRWQTPLPACWHPLEDLTVFMIFTLWLSRLCFLQSRQSMDNTVQYCQSLPEAQESCTVGRMT